MTAESPRGAAALRAMLLASKPSDFGLAPTPELPHVWAAMMEMQFAHATARDVPHSPQNFLPLSLLAPQAVQVATH